MRPSAKNILGSKGVSYAFTALAATVVMWLAAGRPMPHWSTPTQAAGKCFSNGTTGFTTSADGWNTLMSIPPGDAFVSKSYIDNEGSAPLFYRIDGVTPLRLPAGSCVWLTGLQMAGGIVEVERVPGGANLSNVFGGGIP